MLFEQQFFVSEAVHLVCDAGEKGLPQRVQTRLFGLKFIYSTFGLTVGLSRTATNLPYEPVLK